MYRDGLKKKFMIMTVAVVTVTLILFSTAAAFLAYLLNSSRDYERKQMQLETAEYRDRILNQVDTTMQILTTLAKAYEVSDIASSNEKLVEIMSSTNQANDFISMLYIRSDGTGIINAPDYGTIDDITYSDCHPEAVNAMREAFTGKNTISGMFTSLIYNEKVFVYSVPVYKNGEIIGVLSAADNIDFFTEMANENTVLSGSGYIHLIDSSGKFLVRSENTIVDERLDSIFDGHYLSEQTKRDTQIALNQGESIFGEFSSGRHNYIFYVDSLGINDWNLFCANTYMGSSALGETFIGVVVALLFFVISIAVFMLFFGYRIYKIKSNELLHVAYFDALTGADNTFKFDEDFQYAIKETSEYSVAALNIHNFKGINDLFGRERGDKVLSFVKSVIEDNLKEGEFFCRDAGDLFYIFLKDTDEEVLRRRMGEIVSYIRNTSLSYGEYSYDIGFYCGIAVRKDKEHALIALQSIRTVQHEYIAFYNKELHDEIRHKNRIESYMNIGLENREFKLFLQPEFDLSTNELVRAEALVRWQKPDGTFRYPNEFIPLFESNGFCIKLDMYMVERACEQIRKWMDAGIKPIPISVNQSRLLLSNLNYPKDLENLTKKYGVPPSLITVEILEGTQTDDIMLLRKQIDSLRSRGFRVSMDDFGSGYSSLNMLGMLRIDELKLDRGFLNKFTGDEAKRQKIILRQILAAAKDLGITTVAEGIETVENMEMMKSLYCDQGQGYFYEKPMDSEKFSEKYMK